MADRTRRNGTTLLRIALAIFAIGLLAIVAIFAVPAISGDDPPLWLYLTAIIFSPLGFVLALVFALMSGRRAR